MTNDIDPDWPGHGAAGEILRVVLGTEYTALYTVYRGESLNTVHLDTAHCSHTHQSTATEP